MKLFNKLIFNNRNLGLLFSGQLISQMGDSMFLIALMWLVLDITGSKSTMGIVAFVAHIPNLTIAFLSGILVDNFNRKRLMLFSDFSRGIIVLAIPVFYFLNQINLVVIFLTAFMLSSFSTIFNPSRDAIIPEIVQDKNLLKANSLIQSSNYLAILLGPIIGAFLIDRIGVIHLFTADSITFFISFFTIIFLNYSFKKETFSKKIEIFSSLKEIWFYVLENKKLKILLILTAVNNFFIMGPAIVGIPVFVKEALGKDASSYALVESCYGIGMIAGSILINYLNKYFNKGKLLLIGLLFDGITYAVLYFVGSLNVLMIAIVIHAIGIPFIVVSRTSMIQEWTENKRLGRVFSLVNISVVGMTALTTAFTGVITELIGVRLLFAVFGIGGMLCGITGYFYKTLREA